MRRSDTIKVYFSFILWPFLLTLLQVDAFLLTAVFASIRLCDTNNFNKVSLTKMYHYTETESPYVYIAWKIVGQPPYIFFHEARHWKVRKVIDPGFWIKVQVGSETSKSIKNEVFRVLAKILSTQIYIIFCFNTKVSMVF